MDYVLLLQESHSGQSLELDSLLSKTLVALKNCPDEEVI